MKTKTDHLARDAVEWVEAEVGMVTDAGAKALKVASDRISTYSKKALDFAKRNPMVTFVAIAAVGTLAAWAIKSRKPHAELRH